MDGVILQLDFVPPPSPTEEQTSSSHSPPSVKYTRTLSLKTIMVCSLLLDVLIVALYFLLCCASRLGPK
jgi:hypothetical protein